MADLMTLPSLSAPVATPTTNATPKTRVVPPPPPGVGFFLSFLGFTVLGGGLVGLALVPGMFLALAMFLPVLLPVLFLGLLVMGTVAAEPPLENP